MKWDLRSPLQASKSLGKVNALRLVIPFPHHKLSGPQPTHPLSSRPERSAVEGSAVPVFPTTNQQIHNRRTLCHPDRSVAQWRDLQFPFPHRKSSGPQATHPLSSRPKRSGSGGICSSRFPTANHQVQKQRTLCHPDRSVAQWRDLRFRSLRFVLRSKQLALRVLGNRLENYLAIFLRIHFSPNLGNRPVRCDQESIALVEFHILESHQRDPIGSGSLAF
jgi:hypothetical protein